MDRREPLDAAWAMGCFQLIFHLKPNFAPPPPRYVDVEEEETTLIAMSIKDLQLARQGGWDAGGLGTQPHTGTPAQVPRQGGTVATLTSTSPPPLHFICLPPPVPLAPAAAAQVEGGEASNILLYTHCEVGGCCCFV